MISMIVLYICTSVQRQNVVRIHHGQREAIVGEGDGQDLVLVDHGDGHQLKHARVEVHFGQIDVLDAHLAIGFFQALGQDGGKREADFGILQHQRLKIRLLQHGAGGGLQ